MSTPPPTSPRRPAAPAPVAARRRSPLRKLATRAFTVLVVLYVVGVVAGYSWARYLRKNDHIGLMDVALFRWPAVRRGIGEQQFTKGRAEWDAKKYQSAYVWYTAALHNAPDNVAGRLEAARFLRAVGSTGMALTVLEEGLMRAPQDPALGAATFDLLFAAGRDRRVLELLQKLPGSAFGGDQGLLLRSYEVRATQATAGAAAAQQVAARYPELQDYLPAAPVLAQVRWESSQRLAAITLLDRYVKTSPDDLGAYTKLAEWQDAGGLSTDAVATLRRAIAKFPGRPEPRTQLLGELDVGSQAWTQELEGCLKDFGGRPDGLNQLALLAGSKGWVGLARTLYLLGANRQEDLGMLAVSYGDALARNSRMADYAELLAQIETQLPEDNTAFRVMLQQRQIVAASATGDRAGVRELARRLAAALRSDPEALEGVRRQFAKLGITEAVAELVGVSSVQKISRQP